MKKKNKIKHQPKWKFHIEFTWITWIGSRKSVRPFIKNGLVYACVPIYFDTQQKHDKLLNKLFN